MRKISHVPADPIVRRFIEPKRAELLRIPSYLDILKARWAELPPQTKDDYMARKISTVLPAPSATGVREVPIPDDVDTDLSELYKYLRDNPRERGLAEFDTVDEKNEFIAQAKFWAHTQEVRFRVTKPSTQIPDTAIQFLLAPPLTDEEIAERAERQAARKAKTAATTAVKGK